jgi:hypothetical protein
MILCACYRRKNKIQGARIQGSGSDLQDKEVMYIAKYKSSVKTKEKCTGNFVM